MISINQQNLFSVGEEYYLAHCISADFGMSKGIAVEFNNRFDMKNKLTNKYGFEWDGNGYCILEDKVFNLITKPNYWLKPDYDTLKQALVSMKEISLSKGINQIAMPMIGCGLDRLSKTGVLHKIAEVFNDTSIDILICTL